MIEEDTNKLNVPHINRQIATVALWLAVSYSHPEGQKQIRDRKDNQKC